MSDYNESAKNIVGALGGSGNIEEIENCITRLRVTVTDESKINEGALKALPETMGVVGGKTTQIILGPGKVDKTYDAVDELLKSQPKATANSTGSAEDTEDLAAKGAAIKAEQKKKNDTPIKNLLRKVANIFVPLIPALIGCGIIAAVEGLVANLVTAGVTPWLAGAVPALKAISTAFMGFLAIFVGMNAAKEFGGTPVIGGAIASIIPFAGVADINVFGNALVPGRGGVLGALFAAVLGAYIERWCRKWAPDSLSMLIVPTVTILLAGLATIYILMTVFGYVADGIGVAADWLLLHGGIIAAPVLAGVFLPMVMLGLHQALIPIHTTLIQQDGYTVLLPILAMAGGGQVGAAIAIYQKFKTNNSLRNTIKSALPAGFLGVGEPLIYGVSLPLGRPFMTACFGGAVGGLFMGIFSQFFGITVGSKAIGPSGLALLPLLDGSHGFLPAFFVYLGGLVCAYVGGYLITMKWGFNQDTMDEAASYDEISNENNPMAAIK
ncbi:MAG: PTS transporter subunit EIIC [Micrococcaceae bacterium]